jgi:cytochrome c553
MKRVWAFLGFAACACAVAAAGPAAKPDIEKGRKIATQVCAACHGADGNSPSSANPKIAGQVPEYLQKQLANFKAAPGRKAARENPIMGGMTANLSPEDMRDVAAFYGTQQARSGAAQNKETIALGRKIWRGGDAPRGLAACASCHGVAGAGLPAQYPRIAGQYAEYTDAQLKAFRSGQRANDPSNMMRTIAAKMSDHEIGAVADYAAGLR